MISEPLKRGVLGGLSIVFLLGILFALSDFSLSLKVEVIDFHIVSRFFLFAALLPEKVQLKVCQRSFRPK
jgi:hypothetical protein